jgi:hypothetical protein
LQLLVRLDGEGKFTLLVLLLLLLLLLLLSS